MITVGATLASAVIGTAAAWFVERTRLPGRALWAVLTVAPLAMPAFITSYAWVSLSLDLQDFAGALLVITSAYFPLVYLPVAAALRGMDPALEESARVARLRTRATVFARVVLPQLRPALLGGMLLVALGVLSEFGAFTLLRFRTFTTQIYAEYRTSFDGGGASLLACILIADVSRRASRSNCACAARRVMNASIAARVARRCVTNSARGAGSSSAGFAALVIVTLGVPLGMIGYWLTQQGAAAVTPAEVSPELLFDATIVVRSASGSLAALRDHAAVRAARVPARALSRAASRPSFERIVFLAQGVPGLVDRAGDRLARGACAAAAVSERDAAGRRVCDSRSCRSRSSACAPR